MVMPQAEFLITASELHDHIHDPDWRVVDCRFDLSQPDKGYADFLAGHVPGAVYAHLDHDLAAPVQPSSGRHPLPAPRQFARTLGRWGISRATRAVVYDSASGAIAARLWWMLRWLGHGDVRLLDGGFDAWCRSGFEVSTEEPGPLCGTYPGNAADDWVITTPELQQALERGAPGRLLDARDPARFRGDSEPIDAVAGHIPGARNLPFALSLNADGSWRGRQELETLWQSVLGDPAQPWVAMCGSGVTACHLALSAALAGYAPPRLYAGSWSEWIRDRGRPVATAAGDGSGGTAAGAR